jgi:peptidoglycan/xylan/chitin deacetylase (PgdA/CDA1 family)
MSIQLHAAVILQYHHISSEAPVSTSITPERFLQHLELIETEGFRVVSLAEILSSESIEKSSSGPQAQAIFDRRVAITFDDGYSSVYTNAYPLLKRRQWPFTVFVNSGPIDTGRAGVMTWDQLREMAANGASIANHTVDHQHLLQRLIGEDITQWRDRVMADIHQAESRILAEIGVSHRLLAYPYGEYNRELQQLLESSEYRALGQQSGPLAGIHSNQALPRFVFGGHYGSPEDFRIKLNALPFPATALTIRTRQGFKADGVVDDSDETIGLDLALSQALGKVQCFGPVALKVEQSSMSLKVKFEGLLPVGRSRINCTVRHASGHFRWFSHPFFRPSSSGQWLE